MIRRLVEMLFRRPDPAHDERSIKGKQLEALRVETHRQTGQIARIRRDAILAEQRLAGRR